MRLTRIITSIGELGHSQLQTPLVKRFLYEVIVTRELEGISEDTLQYWIDAVMNDDERCELYSLYIDKPSVPLLYDVYETSDEEKNEDEKQAHDYEEQDKNKTEEKSEDNKSLHKESNVEEENDAPGNASDKKEKEQTETNDTDSNGKADYNSDESAKQETEQSETNDKESIEKAEITYMETKL